MDKKQLAKQYNVSLQTINNWLKNGFDTKDKLHKRANKQYKDTINKDFVFSKFDDNTGFEYENSLGESNRNKLGIYYTPITIVKDMLNFNLDNNLTFLDPCCGSGNFIIEVLRMGFKVENVYGYDIDENAVYITKQRIKEEFGYETNNIKVCNFLDEKVNMKFDYIFTNPPYGVKFSKELKNKYAKEFNTSLDSSAFFMSKCLNLLNSNGIISFLVQNAFFNISAYTDIRKQVSQFEILKIKDFKKSFDIVTTVQSITIKNNKVDDCLIDCGEYKRSLKSFKNNPNYIFNYWCSVIDADKIEKIYSKKYITLKDAIWGMGIVTGNNVKHLKNGTTPVYKGSDVLKNGFKEPSNFIQPNFKEFQQVAPLHLYESNKIVYKFITNKLCFAYDANKRYLLNSANFFITDNMDKIVELLNSDIINWLFQKLFNTCKILKSDLMLLPIHIDYFNVYETFDELYYLKFLEIEKG